MSKKKPNLQDFFENADIRNQWIRHRGVLDAYVRKTMRYSKITLDVANVTVDEFKKGKGHFRKFVQEVYQLAIDYGYEQIYFENVINPQLGQKFSILVRARPDIWSQKESGNVYSYFLAISDKENFSF